MKDYTKGLTKKQADIKAIELLNNLYQKSWYNLEFDHKDKAGYWYKHMLQGYANQQTIRVNNFYP